MSAYVFNGGTVVPMTGEDDLIDAGAVVVSDGEIEAVHDEPINPADYEDYEIIDLEGQIVLPGLINAHTHLYQVLLRAVWEDITLIPWLEKVYLTAEVLTTYDCHLGTLAGAAENVQSGVTTILEHQFLNPTREHTTATIDALQQIGVRTVYARTIMDQGDIVPPSVNEDPSEALAEVENLLSKYETGHMFSVRTGPNTPPVNTSTDCCEQISAFVDDHPEIGISAHVSESEAVVEQVREDHGFDGVAEYLDSVGLTGPECIYAHCVHLTSPEVELMADTGTAMSHNPVSNMMLGDGTAPLIDALGLGVTVGLGTDGAASTQTQDMVETMKGVSMMHKNEYNDPSVIEPYEILELATTDGAKAVGLQEYVGTLEAGKRADLIVIDLESSLHNVTVNNLYSQLVHTMRATDVQSTMVDGKFVMRDRTLLTADVDYLTKECQEAGVALRERVDKLDDAA